MKISFKNRGALRVLRHNGRSCVTADLAYNRGMSKKPRPAPLPRRHRLIQDIEAFLEKTGMKPTPFGLSAARDDKLLWRIKNAPNGISLDKYDRVRVYMDTYYRAREEGVGHDSALGRAEAVAASMMRRHGGTATQRSDLIRPKNRRIPVGCEEGQ